MLTLAPQLASLVTITGGRKKMVDARVALGGTSSMGGRLAKPLSRGRRRAQGVAQGARQEHGVAESGRAWGAGQGWQEWIPVWNREVLERKRREEARSAARSRDSAATPPAPGEKVNGEPVSAPKFGKRRQRAAGPSASRGCGVDRGSRKQALVFGSDHPHDRIPRSLLLRPSVGREGESSAGQAAGRGERERKNSSLKSECGPKAPP
ncbi:hypothetical protein KM043_011131 [Ampulex compressa]|nr:hypothetical protein KM043_011131 [Ampulex compressa]